MAFVGDLIVRRHVPPQVGGGDPHHQARSQIQKTAAARRRSRSAALHRSPGPGPAVVRHCSQENLPGWIMEMTIHCLQWRRESKRSMRCTARSCRLGTTRRSRASGLARCLHGVHVVVELVGVEVLRSHRGVVGCVRHGASCIVRVSVGFHSHW